ncbi:MAG: hypothetical protein NXI02_33545, partial [Rhodobacteraceae bacterium]|nr:hypothetical protein [Paracoccaceae bacterium]
MDVGWDIDGDANNDTQFSVFGGGSYLYFNAGFEGGFGFVSNANDLVALGSGFQVGAAMGPFDFNSG